jgi:hypothetical protein
MLTTLASVKSRLSLPDNTFDDLLTAAIKSVSARFDNETNRTLARTENAIHEFDPNDTELSPSCYPIETVSRFETKTSESTGWQEVQPMPDHLIRGACIITLPVPMNHQLATCNLQPATVRVTYTGGYLLPGSDPVAGCQALPDDLEQACVEQVAFWYQRRDLLGVRTTWPQAGNYEQFAAQDLLPSVIAVLKRHQRLSL